MTLQDLIDELEFMKQTHGGNIEVMTSSDYGDICHTEQLSEIRSVTACIPNETGYSHSGLAFPDEDEDYEDSSEEEMQKIRDKKERDSQKEQTLVLRYK